MSNPPSSYKPAPYFSGIVYNPTDFINNSTTAVLTYADALKLFLQKNTPITLTYSPSAITSNQLGYTTTDTITLTSLTSGTAVNLFSSNISLPAGVWLITYSLRLSSATNITFSSTNIYGIDNVNGTSIVYGQQGNNYGSANTVYAFTGTFIIKATAGSITSYNISFYSIYTTGSPALVTTGALCSNIQRTRIG